MRAFTVSVLLIVLIALIPGSALAGNWAGAKKDAAHTSYADDVISPPLKVAWAIKAESGIIASPVIFDGTVIYADDPGGSLVALNLTTGARIWSVKTGGAIEGTPVITDGMVIAGSYDRSVYCVRLSDGSLVWKRQIADGMYSSPLVYEDRVYLGTDGPDFYALDLKTGDVMWKLTGNSTQGSPAGAGGKVFAGMFDGKVYALEASTGKVLWSHDTGDKIHSSPMVYNETVYIANRGGILYAFDQSTGAVKWTADLGYMADATPSVDPVSGTIFIGTYGGYVKAFDASSGKLKWISKFYGPVYSTATVSGDTVYQVTHDGVLVALNASDGLEGWSYPLGWETFGSPAAADGYLVIGTLAQDLIAFKHSEEQPAVTPSVTPVIDTGVKTGSSPESGSAAAPFPGIMAILIAMAAAALVASRR